MRWAHVQPFVKKTHRRHRDGWRAMGAHAHQFRRTHQRKAAPPAPPTRHPLRGGTPEGACCHMRCLCNVVSLSHAWQAPQGQGPDKPPPLSRRPAAHARLDPATAARPTGPQRGPSRERRAEAPRRATKSRRRPPGRLNGGRGPPTMSPGGGPGNAYRADKLPCTRVGAPQMRPLVGPERGPHRGLHRGQRLVNNRKTAQVLGPDSAAPATRRPGQRPQRRHGRRPPNRRGPCLPPPPPPRQRGLDPPPHNRDRGGHARSEVATA